MANDLSELIERVRGAKGPDAQLDSDICRALSNPILRGWTIHPVTESLDAAIALAERVLPGWNWDVCGYCHASILEKGEGGRFYEARATTPALALCLAILTAIKAQEDGREE